MTSGGNNEMTALLDPRIGKLSNGKFYCFPDGNGKPEFVGALEEVEAALGIRQKIAIVPGANAPTASSSSLWVVKLSFQYPAWDEMNGIEYRGIIASSKRKANEIARRLAANDGHLCGGKGRVTFVATADQ